MANPSPIPCDPRSDDGQLPGRGDASVTSSRGQPPADTEGEAGQQPRPVGLGEGVSDAAKGDGQARQAGGQGGGRGDRGAAGEGVVCGCGFQKVGPAVSHTPTHLDLDGWKAGGLGAGGGAGSQESEPRTGLPKVRHSQESHVTSRTTVAPLPVSCHADELGVPVVRSVGLSVGPNLPVYTGGARGSSQ